LAVPASGPQVGITDSVESVLESKVRDDKLLRVIARIRRQAAAELARISLHGTELELVSENRAGSNAAKMAAR
jgi:hypothetical protein